jgi:dTDP-4-dehydrorhamnose reductase
MWLRLRRAAKSADYPLVRFLRIREELTVRIAITGKQGQVVSSLIDVGPNLDVEVVPVGRPELDLSAPETVHRALANVRPDVIVNAAAYTAVDQAEKEPDQAMAINANGAGAVANAAGALGVPLIHLSTDYVFDGRKSTPYVEEDPVEPINVYGASKLAGERAVAAATDDYVIVRTAWVYSSYGKNFVRTMLTLAQTRDELRVVADQYGCPTYARDIAVGLVAIARNLSDRPKDKELRGIFHLAGTGETNWAEFASTIFESLRMLGKRVPVVKPITTVEYPTPARRPANSRLDCSKLACSHSVQLPPWQTSFKDCVSRLVPTS